MSRLHRYLSRTQKRRVTKIDPRWRTIMYALSYTIVRETIEDLTDWPALFAQMDRRRAQHFEEIAQSRTPL